MSGPSAWALVGDIGGTNARFALVDMVDGEPRLTRPLRLADDDFPGPVEAIEAYLREVGAARPACAMLAVAGPVGEGRAQLTNRPGWRFSVEALLAAGFSEAGLVNDFQALGWAARRLMSEGSAPLGPPLQGDPFAPVTIMGPGTGFGAAVAHSGAHGTTVTATEAGHMGYAPVDELETDLVRRLGREGRVTVERLLSGPGLARLHVALGEIEGRHVEPLAASEITRIALEAPGSDRRITALRFCAMLGSVAGDLALANGARGGVLLTGGVATRLAPLLPDSDFRARFEAKAPLESYVCAIPTRIVTDPHAALLGAALALRAGAGPA